MAHHGTLLTISELFNPLFLCQEMT